MATVDRRGVSVSAVDAPIVGDPNPGLAIKAPCLVATTGAIVLSGLQTVDGVALAAGNRVLVWQQADQTTNGIYNASTGPWTRSVDAASNDQWTAGMLVVVSSGAVNINLLFECTTANPITLGSSNITFSSNATLAVARGGTGGGTASGTLLDNITGFSSTGFLTRTGAGTYAFVSTTNGITDAMLAQAGAATLKGNPTGSTANVQDFTIQGLTNLAAPSATLDFIPIYDHATGLIKNVTPGAIASSLGAGVASFNTLTGAVTSAVVVQKFTAGGTYTPTAGMLHAIIECVGGGGAGGSSAGVSGGVNVAPGGGSGSYSRKFVTAAAVGASQTVTIGAGGTPGSAGGFSGGAGGNTSVGALCIGEGGGGGGTGNGSVAGAAGVAGTGDITAAGTPGGGGFFATVTTSNPSGAGYGGSSVFGGGAAPINSNANSNGNAAAEFGAGGGGAALNNTASNFAGGAGSGGIVIITEFVNL